jgi:hypothetical protein
VRNRRPENNQLLLFSNTGLLQAHVEEADEESLSESEASSDELDEDSCFDGFLFFLGAGDAPAATFRFRRRGR